MPRSTISPALSRFREKRRSEALQHFQFAVSREPNNVGYLNNLGRLYHEARPGRAGHSGLSCASSSSIRNIRAPSLAIGEFFEKMGRADKGLPYLENYHCRPSLTILEASCMYGTHARSRSGDTMMRRKSIWRLEENARASRACTQSPGPRQEAQGGIATP